ncbi:MAG: hypothetical protein Q8L64_06080 [bacterium]|nr:hypothetical protein [bacterium]
MAKKDNFTDVVQNLPKTPPAPAPKQPAPQQVSGSNGEVITLGHNQKK